LSLEYLTTCIVHNSITGAVCGQKIKANPLEVPIVGEPPSMRAQRLVAGLYKHLEKAHPEMAAQVGLAAMMLQGFMILRCFDTPDPNLQIARENARSEIGRISRKNLLTDDAIIEALAKAGCDQKQIETIGPVVRQMRDFVMELGPYSVQAQHQPPPNGNSAQQIAP
jgi:hypothetical protein